MDSGTVIKSYKVVSIRFITLYGIITESLSAYFTRACFILTCYSQEGVRRLARRRDARVHCRTKQPVTRVACVTSGLFPSPSTVSTTSYRIPSSSSSHNVTLSCRGVRTPVLRLLCPLQGDPAPCTPC